MDPVFITDDEIISPLGFSSEENIENLRKGISGIRPINDENLAPFPFYGAKISSEKLAERFSSIANIKEFTKLEQMMILAIHKLVAKHPETDFSQTLLVVSTTKGNIDLLKNESGFPKKRVKLFELARVIKEYFQFKNEPIVVSNACVSGALSIGVAKKMLQSKKYKNAIVVAGDILSEFVLSGFNSFQALDNKICEPYSKNRNGINLGEAAAAVLLEKKATSTNAIKILGEASVNDANHISGPSRTGEGLQKSVKNALLEANISTEKIDFISAHGTATLFNDEMEAIAFHQLNLAEKPLYSLKAYYGHTLGASALIESIIVKHALQHNELYKSLGYYENGVTKPLTITEKYEQKPLKIALKTASGFGGCNYAIIFEKNHA
ncbi:beta-ketoacyl synthase N-terminal-like domain-containing protein [Mesonia maritima]|uniref:3-oxoacyl-[acyl-carrier-protein] synthase-1 n=1 Tax=Mesonia maritima TaxID=1793873 RepID=A0ABU1K7R9_9FLAO|nr:beta-ketoacyl synthase N-terminal-like domain-containing protein [Mesonia maritima]MDR6301672.1 3-oxoacyl-[acyl-carrier-protein] synthase-1 [Mesonia maritima]